MTELLPFMTKEDIDKKVSALARRISADYENRDLVIIGVLKGSFIFLSDLVRRLTIPVQIDFVGASSYGSGVSSSGSIRLTKEIGVDVKGKDVLLVDDIIDTGLTLAYLVDHIKSFGPKSVRICIFLDKKERRKTALMIDYTCQVVESGFLVGYGLDYAENYRNLPEIYQLKL
ncbi:MAG TPA: hypoxanthine phosphoribosyltransferase [Desulfobacterales bacterium]|nr:hypoxanthine phosphoribosyltransferase [Desulfobacterales bacterium]